MTVERLSFAPLIYASKKQILSEKASKIFYMGDLHLQLPSTDLQSEFGTGEDKTVENLDGTVSEESNLGGYDVGVHFITNMLGHEI